MGGDTDWVHHTSMLVMPATLIWARSGSKSGTVVASTRLKDIQVRDFESDLIEDRGMEDYGFAGDSKGRVQAFIGLGPELAAFNFSEVVKEAVAEAQK